MFLITKLFSEHKAYTTCLLQWTPSSERALGEQPLRGMDSPGCNFMGVSALETLRSYPCLTPLLLRPLLCEEQDNTERTDNVRHEYLVTANVFHIS